MRVNSHRDSLYKLRVIDLKTECTTAHNRKALAVSICLRAVEAIKHITQHRPAQVVTALLGYCWLQVDGAISISVAVSMASLSPFATTP